MAPKKGTARVVKPRKSTTTAAATAARDAAKVDGDLHLMWLCFKNNNSGQVDYQNVADGLGITKSAAKQRYYKIKNHFEGLQTPQTTQEAPKPESQAEEEQDELPDYKSEDDKEDQGMKQEQPDEDLDVA